MRRLLPRALPRRVLAAPVLVPLVWLLAVAALGGAGLRWSLPLKLPPPAPPLEGLEGLDGHEQAASAAPAPRHVTRSLAELGLAGPLAPRGLSDYAVLLTRVPRAGAELLSLLLQRLQLANGFRLLQLPGKSSGRLSPTEQEELVVEVTDTLRREAVPVAFHGSVYFTNFSTFDRQSPTYVGLLRDPVARVIAGYRSASAVAATMTTPQRRARAADDAELLSALERCLASLASTPRPECAWAEPQTPYFCGHDSRCRDPDGDWAFRRAKANIDQYFPVVGVLEEPNATLAVLETRLPLFFTGVSDLYRHRLLHEHHANWNRVSANLKPGVRRRVEKRLSLEYELYLWAKQRLMQQFFEDSQKLPVPGEAGEDRIAHSIHKREQSLRKSSLKD
ncbi:uronyl 2-sulfotransferase-like [Thrips palmi]|uniref:Uronyl 2-sulfotransferase-like n=1 Tax=Thrips palmi TaxID=161013 RepID=A0A6P8Z115_THRPL|nr:uronyl 2-sulfotransferase-like [Thrips palmi]